MTHSNSEPELESGRIYITIDSGRVVSIERIYIELSTLGVLEGNFNIIRKNVLEKIPNRAKALFQNMDILGDPATPSISELPTYVIFASLISFEPIKDGVFSSLLYWWMTNDLPTDLVTHIKEKIRAIDWDKYAGDGLF